MLPRAIKIKSGLNYIQTLKEDPTKSYVTRNNMVGVADDEGKVWITPKFYSINKDVHGNHVCVGNHQGKEFCEVYDKNFNRIR